MTPSLAIEALILSGMTESAIGEKVGARQSTVNRIRHGRMQPNYELGKALVDLASRRRKKAKPQDVEAAA